MNSNQPCYAIVVGESKAGTSSIFRYLGDHPEIQTTVVKQTNYFLARNYKWSDNAHTLLYETDKGQSFLNLFGNISPEKKVLLDVSPDYMYCAQTPLFLKEYLKEKEFFIIFILRDPIERLLSWYRFGMQIKLVPDDMDFSTFLDKQGDKDQGSMAFNAMESGRFLKYIKEYEAVIPPERLITLPYVLLKRDPRSFMATITNFFKLSPEYYEDYEFNIHNRSEKVRFGAIQGIYVACQRRLHRILSSHMYLQPIIKYPTRFLAKIYRRINMAESEPVVIDQQTLERLKNYYTAEYAYLQTLEVAHSQKPD